MGRYQARADAATERAAQAERDLSDARISLAERQRDSTAINQKISQMNLDSNQAEKQLDSMEDKARLFDEAGRKLELAATVDNPVDRATLELDAEKLLKNASGIDLKVDAIIKVTGQDLQLPATPAPVPTPPVADASSDTPTADSPTSDTDVAASGASQPLQDEFAVAAPADGDADIGGCDPTRRGSTVVQSDTPVDTGLLDDPLGVGTAGTQPIDAAPSLEAPAPQNDVAVASIGPENNTDTFAPSPDPALDAPDPTSDVNAFAADPLADVGTVAPVDDTFAGDANASDDVNVTTRRQGREPSSPSCRHTGAAGRARRGVRAAARRRAGRPRRVQQPEPAPSGRRAGRARVRTVDLGGATRRDPTRTTHAPRRRTPVRATPSRR